MAFASIVCSSIVLSPRKALSRTGETSMPAGQTFDYQKYHGVQERHALLPVEMLSSADYEASTRR
jgi:hypothetical protein